MTIRSKLNLAVVVLVLIFLVASGFAMRAVRDHAKYTRTYTRMRDLEQLTASILAGIYR